MEGHKNIALVMGVEALYQYFLQCLLLPDTPTGRIAFLDLWVMWYNAETKCFDYEVAVKSIDEHKDLLKDFYAFLSRSQPRQTYAQTSFMGIKKTLASTKKSPQILFDSGVQIPSHFSLRLDSKALAH